MNIKNDEEYFWNNNNLVREYNIGINLFVNSPNTALDLEIKPDDFGIFETTETNSSKIYSPTYQSNETQKTDSNQNSSFSDESIYKNKIFEIQKCPKSVSEILFKKSYTDNCSSIQSVKAISTPTENNVFVKPFDSLTFAERMRIKKEKAKMLLEKKREKREEETLTANESQLIEISSSYSVEMKTNLPNEKEINKKEMKAIRNRISAQLSRDRKKKEFEELQKFSQKLLDENKLLKKDLKNKNREIINLNNQITKLCKNCCKYFEDQVPIYDSSQLNNGLKLRTGNSYLKYGLISSFIVIVCIIASCMLTGDYSGKKQIILSNDANFEPRYLISNSEDSVKDFSILEEEEEDEKESIINFQNESKLDDPFDTNKENDYKSKSEENTTNNTSNALMTREEIIKKEFIDFAVFANKKFQVGDINLSKYLKYYLS